MELSKIDFDFWCNSKRDIVLTLKQKGDVESISELSRLINRSFSVTHRHVVELNKRGILIYRKIEPGKRKMISLKYPGKPVEMVLYVQV